MRLNSTMMAQVALTAVALAGSCDLPEKPTSGPQIIIGDPRNVANREATLEAGNMAEGYRNATPRKRAQIDARRRNILLSRGLHHAAFTIRMEGRTAVRNVDETLCPEEPNVKCQTVSADADLTKAMEESRANLGLTLEEVDKLTDEHPQ